MCESNLIKKDVLEWIIETEEGDWTFSKEFDLNNGKIGEVVFTYSFAECDRLGIPLSKCPNAVVMYSCDMKFSVDGGFAKVTDGNEILFMMQRRLIKNIITKINGKELD